MIAVSSLEYEYASSAPLVFPDFAVEAGKSCVLLGNSGTGKTTLLHLLGGLLRIKKGSVVISGLDIGKISESMLDRFRGKHVGFVFQRNHLISALSVKENLLMAPFLADLPQDDHRLEEVLAQLGLWEKKHARISELSQGQVQRVAIARAVLNRPAVILADEPTSALDDHNCERVITLLMNVSRQSGAALVVATHDQRLKSVISKQVQIGNPI
jgi:putative ABC transport system ATP-binding protein